MYIDANVFDHLPYAQYQKNGYGFANLKLARARHKNINYGPGSDFIVTRCTKSRGAVTGINRMWTGMRKCAWTRGARTLIIMVPARITILP